MTEEEILLELQEIRKYMESKNAYHGYGQMSDLILKLESEKSQLKPQEGEWINIDKTKPERGKGVMILLKSGFITIGYRKKDELAWQLFGNKNIYVKDNDYVTHWMPLPAPPKG